MKMLFVSSFVLLSLLVGGSQSLEQQWTSTLSSSVAGGGGGEGDEDVGGMKWCVCKLVRDLVDIKNAYPSIFWANFIFLNTLLVFCTFLLSLLYRAQQQPKGSNSSSQMKKRTTKQQIRFAHVRV